MRRALVIDLERFRRSGVTAAPDLHLFLAVTRDGFLLVQPLQHAVMALVEKPRVVDGNPHAVHFLESEPECLDGAFENRRESEVEDVAFRAKNAAGGAGLFHAQIRKWNVGPACETILLVPCALPVAKQNERLHAESGYHVIG